MSKTFLEALTSVGKSLQSGINKLNETKIDQVNIKELGADNTGATDCTTILQNALDNNKVVYAPSGTYKVTTITLNANNVLIGDGKLSTIIDATNGIAIPYDATGAKVEDITINNGISIGATGTLAAQDMSPQLKNVRVLGGDIGVYLNTGVRGGIFENVSVGNSTVGFKITGTDNIFLGCISAMTPSHGFIVIGANNGLNACKAFCAGISQYGVAFNIRGICTRMTNCEAQQNCYENYWIQNAYSSIITGCISDAAGYHSTEDTYSNTEFGTIPYCSVYIHNVDSAIIDISILNGRNLDGNCKVAYAIGSLYPKSNNRNKITLTVKNNLFTCKDYYLGTIEEFLVDNSLTINHRNFNTLCDKTSYNYFDDDLVLESGKGTKTTAIKLPNDIKKVVAYIENVEKPNGTVLGVDVMCVLNASGSTLYKNTNRIDIANDSIVSFDVSSFLASYTYDSITSISLRFLFINSTEEILTATVANVTINEYL